VSLPDLLEITPLSKPVRAEITVPGSKSITNRALILAALAEGETTLEGALWSEDTQVMVECLQELGFMINVQPDLKEVCNRRITVYGKGGAVPRGGNREQPLELFVGNAGTAARFLAAFVCLGQGVYRLSGVPRMHERPQAELFAALRQLGYGVESEQNNARLPARISVEPCGAGSRTCAVSVERSSQFASALLLCARVGGWQVRIEGENAEESPYVRMTSELVGVFPRSGGKFGIEPDASSGSYFQAAALLNADPQALDSPAVQTGTDAVDQLMPIRVAHWPTSGWQIDQNFLKALGPGLPRGLQMCASGRLPVGERGKATEHESPADPPISRARHLGDSIMTAIVLAPFSTTESRFTDLGRLRVQECERVQALRTELNRCGAKVVEEGDTLTVYPSALHGAAVETYDDHRMAMCFAILGLKIHGMQIKNPACVKKTFPNFFQKLSAAPPNGLGVEVRDGSGRKLAMEELFAD
jgi:3-phosphoshikimate 1-carboxyvinyltransferase